MTIKLKTLVFSKEANYQFDFIDEVINKLWLMDLVNAMVRIVYTEDIMAANNNLILKEYIAKD